MPAYYDEKTKTWYCKFYYQDWTGTRKQKLKRGFKLQREAKTWERDFLDKQSGNPDMTFEALVNLYMEDMTTRLKESTMVNKKSVIENLLLPYFKDKPISSITSTDIRKWQSTLMGSTSSKGTPFAPGTIRYIDRQMAAILNYATRHYGLIKNPHSQAGSVGEYTVRVQFWTKEEFDTFIAVVNDPRYRTIFYTLYYTGLRLGELQALTLADINFDERTITVSKTFKRLNGHDAITSPKTKHSNRTVTIPPFIAELLKAYTDRMYGLSNSDRLFTCVSSSIRIALIRYCTAANVHQISPHGLRHSHVSLLLDMGFSPHLIAERIGDSVDMVNNTYGHLYPDRHAEVAQKLQEIVSN